MTILNWNLEERATRGAILDSLYAQMSDALQAEVESQCNEAGIGEGHYHTIAEVYALVDTLAVSDRVKNDLRAVYRILAEAEATAHGCSVEETHFHEVGNASGIRNALHICLAVEACNVEEIVATRVQTGEGVVHCAHGELPIPAPATAAILARGIPVCTQKLPGELCTPTSAAIIWHFVDRFDV